MSAEPFDLSRLKVLPLARRDSLSAIDRILVDPCSKPCSVSAGLRTSIAECAAKIQASRDRGASVLLMYGAHLVKNGAMQIVNELVRGGWITHLATNGAGVIHDWELAFQGRTEESVRKNVATGTFGAWDETGRSINTAVLAGGIRSEGFGRSIGRFICENGVVIPEASELKRLLREEPEHPLAAARADLLQAIVSGKIRAGQTDLVHRHSQSSILAGAFRLNVLLTVHPGIGYDIFTNHPSFSGAAVGRAAAIDYQFLCSSVSNLEGGVVLSVGSAIMAPQVFEKALSCANNARLQEGRGIVKDHSIYVVDIQDGGKWDWSGGEPPKDNPAYYLRFCKSFARMGGSMEYLQCDNVVFLHNVLVALLRR